jgi:hypothetical protein
MHIPGGLFDDFGKDVRRIDGVMFPVEPHVALGHKERVVRLLHEIFDPVKGLRIPLEIVGIGGGLGDDASIPGIRTFLDVSDCPA